MTKSLKSIQYLRGLAAVGVIFHHVRTPQPWLYDPLANFNAGQAGVDVFFVISGFIMYSSAKNSDAKLFFLKRAVRLVPLYWIATLITLIIATGRHFDRLDAAMGKELLLSFAFIPHYNMKVKSMIWPYLWPGWTLCYEAFFYALFCAGLVIKKPIAVTGIVIVFLVILGYFVDFHNAILACYTNSILLEFLLGIAIARFADLLMQPRVWLALPLGALLLVLSDNWPGPRILIWGIPAAMVVVGAVSLEFRNKLPTLAPLGKLGDASYSIYLFQVMTISIAVFIIRKSALTGMTQLISAICISVSACIFVGFLAHLFLERPLLQYLTRLLKPRPG